MSAPTVYPGTHEVRHAVALDRCMISVNRLVRRRSDFTVREWIMDSGAFTRIANREGHMPVKEYAQLANRWARCGRLRAVVSQDYMCEPFVVEQTGASVRKHQEWTTERYLRLRDRCRAYVMPVIQGYDPAEYAEHVSDLSPHLDVGQWVGVGSVCKRNGDPAQISAVLHAVKGVRPDLRLHGFGVKTTSLKCAEVREAFSTVDSMAWSYDARMRHRKDPSEPGANDLEALLRWLERLEGMLHGTNERT